jgi:hypothetical protein
MLCDRLLVSNEAIALAKRGALSAQRFYKQIAFSLGGRSAIDDLTSRIENKVRLLAPYGGDLKWFGHLLSP